MKNTSITPVDTKNSTNLPLERVDLAPVFKYRYYCDACTGIAFYVVDIATAKIPNCCGNCAHPIGPLKKENFIKI